MALMRRCVQAAVMAGELAVLDYDFAESLHPVIDHGRFPDAPRPVHVQRRHSAGN